MKFFRRKHQEVPPEDGEARTVSVAGDDSAAADAGPAGFGYKTAWLAIRTEDTEAVAGALGVTGARAASWAAGIDATCTEAIAGVRRVYAVMRAKDIDAANAAYRAERGRGLVFLTPVVDGWTLAVLGGTELFEDDGLAGGALDLPSLSRRFGEVQKFATHRVVEYQEWQRWVNGSPVRRYCWIGESGRIRFDEGEPARAEGNLLRAADLDQLLAAGGGDWDAFDLAGEETVMAVAAEWSVDPTTLDDRDDLPPRGLLGFAPTGTPITVPATST